jgi:hypothetical protein
MTEVNELQAEILTEHNVIGFQVAMSNVIDSVQVLNCSASLPAKILL